MKQYPCDLLIMTTTEGGIDENGFAMEAQTDWKFHSICREIPAGSGAIVSNESGKHIAYSSKVVMPLGTKPIPANTKIKIIRGEQVVLVGTVIRFSSKQLHCRLWV